jgi:hypothetical protein
MPCGRACESGWRRSADCTIVTNDAQPEAASSFSSGVLKDPLAGEPAPFASVPNTLPESTLISVEPRATLGVPDEAGSAPG